jgi:hypothetical protein
MTNYKIKVPKTGHDVPLYRYQQFLSIDEPTEDDVLLTLAGISSTVISKLQTADVLRIHAHCNDFLNAPDLIREFKMDGVHYGFIPSLDMITWGENKDITDYLPTDENKGKHLHRCMAVLYRPIIGRKGDKYMIEDYKGTHEYAERMKLMPMDVALSALRFFFHLSTDLLLLIPNYIKTEMANDPTFSSENGRHITNSLHLLEGNLRDLTTLFENHYTNV